MRSRHAARRRILSRATRIKARLNRKPSPAKKPRATIDPNKFAIVIAGVGGEEAYTKKFTEQAAHLYDALTNRLGFDEKNVYLLTEATGGGPENGARETDAD